MPTGKNCTGEGSVEIDGLALIEHSRQTSKQANKQASKQAS
ncbi:MAG: hypothetical protein ACTSUE_24140 [Promethearchaeota archaeon]